jgi:hypothetical protein
MSQETINDLGNILAIACSSLLAYIIGKAKEKSFWKKELRGVYDNIFHKDFELSGRVKEFFSLTRVQTDGIRVWLLLTKNGSKYYNGQAIFKLDMVYESYTEGIEPIQDQFQDKSTTLFNAELSLAKSEGWYTANLSEMDAGLLRTMGQSIGTKAVIITPVYKIQDPSEERKLEPIAYIGLSFRDEQSVEQFTTAKLHMSMLRDQVAYELSTQK